MAKREGDAVRAGEVVAELDQSLLAAMQVLAAARRDLAKAADITPAYLSQLEHGDRKASQDVLRRLATALQVDIDDLVPSGA